MTPLAWLLGLILPACGALGAAGLPVPTPMDMAHIARPATPNTFLAGPAGMTPTPDHVIPPWNRPADKLFAAARTVFGAEPRTYVAAVFADRRQIHYVVRSRWLNFPDLVTVEADPDGPARSTLVIWSRGVYGRSDFGANRKRVEAWLADLRSSLDNK
jgi:uncharacterized protein (DUF1499 family)